MENCKNCHTELIEGAEFCHNCGAKIIRNRLSFKNLFEHITETFLNYDNKLLRTIICLFTDPTDVIGGYVKGVRRKYVNPLSFFGLALTLSGLSIFILRKFYMNDIDFSMLVMENNPVNEDIFMSTQNSLQEYNSLFYSAMIPFFGLISWVVFLNKSYNLTEHIVIYLYTMSLMSIISVVLSQVLLFINPDLYMVSGFAILLFTLFYHCRLFKQLFELSWGWLVIKTALFLALLFIIYLGLSILYLVYLIQSGALQLSDFAPK
ncbi:DUF3667 domain-containing protein [Winogradskyella aurantiaca]|uniref:DUF3667 domain-containing protein n=1 Tax=Winogradskyella aurantiaca TaxID=2219558 RepID=UPI001300B4E5|nr:DUF3667 domain-containing protein [Winogradskyella aurantiaca]